MKQLIFSLILFSAFVQDISAQCANWNNSPKKDELENYHVIYRQAIKSQNWTLAFENWQKVFAVAPAADGQRDIQFQDGIELYKQKFTSATTEADKAAAKNKVLELYKTLASCYESKGIPCEGEDCANKKLGYVYGRMAYEMYYTFNEDYATNLEMINKAIEKAGVNNEYVIFAPAANIAVYQFENKLMDKKAVVDLYMKLNEIADYGVNNSGDLSSYFTQAKENMNGTFSKIEDQIFDCEYFAEKYQPEYESDPTNPAVIKRLTLALKGKGCTSSNQLLAQLEEAWKKYATAENAKIQAEFEANNPAIIAKKLYDEGKFGEAIAKYEEAVNESNDPNIKAQLLFGKASIQFRKLGQYGAARATALEAAKLKPNWGRPYMLIGDMYGKTAGGCGDSWTQRMAVIAAIDKYAYARNIDADVAGEASSRIGTYSGSLPDQETGFMRGVKEGSSAYVGCWIGESVRVRFK